jgi:hypothetical protein
MSQWTVESRTFSAGKINQIGRKKMTKSHDQPGAAEEQTGVSTLYRQLGGAAAVDAAVDVFYRKGPIR